MIRSKHVHCLVDTNSHCLEYLVLGAYLYVSLETGNCCDHKVHVYLCLSVCAVYFMRIVCECYLPELLSISVCYVHFTDLFQQHYIPRLLLLLAERPWQRD